MNSDEGKEITSGQNLPMCIPCLVIASTFSWAHVKEETQDLKTRMNVTQRWGLGLQCLSVWLRADTSVSWSSLPGCFYRPPETGRNGKASMWVALPGFSMKILPLKAPPLTVFFT